MDVKTKVFCAGGTVHLPNGSYVTFGGGKAIGLNDTSSDDKKDEFDSRLGVADGRRKAIRLLKPCISKDDFSDEKCTWFDDPSVLSMQKQRWFPAWKFSMFRIVIVFIPRL